MITQLMREVDLVKQLSHPSIVKYEGMTRDENHHPASCKLLSQQPQSGAHELTSAFSDDPRPHVCIRIRVLAPYRRSRASISPTRPIPTRLSCSRLRYPNIIRRKLSIILTRQREPQQATKNNRPQSISSIGSSCANSPRSQASQCNRTAVYTFTVPDTAATVALRDRKTPTNDDGEQVQSWCVVWELHYLVNVVKQKNRCVAAGCCLSLLFGLARFAFPNIFCVDSLHPLHRQISR